MSQKRTRTMKAKMVAKGILLAATLFAVSAPAFADSWQFGPDMPLSRTGTGAAKDNQGRICIPGGILGLGPTGPNTVMADVMRFDETAPAGSEWSVIASLNGPRIHHGVAADALGRIYVIGGYSSNPYINPLDSVERYDPTTDTWTDLDVANLPFPRAEFEAVTDWQGRIYAVGGRDSAMNALASVEVYDPGTNSWSHHSDMQLARYGCALAIDSSDRIYAIGGVLNGSLSSAVERYDPLVGDWTFVDSLSSGRLVGCAAADCNDFIYAIAGYTAGYTCQVERFDPVAGVWEDIDPINQCRNNMGGILGDSGRLYTFGGDAGYASQTTVEFLEIPECENQPPVISCNDPVVLWSPNHELVDVSSAFTVSDPDEDPVTLSFRVISDESETPETGDGTGRHAPDFKDEHDGGRGLLVRSERRGAEDGRYYIFVITADDGNGGVTTEVCVAAIVPHDQDQQSLDDVLAQAEAAALVVQDSVDSGELPPPGLYEHGLADPLGPKQ